MGKSRLIGADEQFEIAMTQPVLRAILKCCSADSRRGLPKRGRASGSRLEWQVEAKLVVVGGDSQTRQFDLHLPAVIGRSRSTDVRLGHPLISRQHCEVFEADGILMVRDLGSLNGTFLGETRVAEDAVPVKPGELLTVGPITLRAEYFGSPANHGKSSTWEASEPTHGEPMPYGTGQVNGDENHTPDPPNDGDDDESSELAE